MDHITHVTGPISQTSSESEYNAACNTVTALAHFRMFIHELLNKYPDIVPEQPPIIILDRKSAMCMDKRGKDTKHASHI